MQYIENNRGFALITSLMLTLISLAIAMAVLYVVTQGISTSASRKVYRNAVEASYGGTSITMLEILPQLASKILMQSTPTTADTTAQMTSLATAFSGINLQFTSNADCLNQKLLNASTNWGLCTGENKSIKTRDIRNRPDMTFTLSGVAGTQFMVYSKIVDTIPGTTYMQLPAGGQPLLGGGVTDTGGATTSFGKHFVYRIEVLGERVNNPSEQGNLSVVYEY